MYALIRAVSLRELVLEQLPSLFVSLFVAEIFFKFGSFTLECVGFLATWFAIDGFSRSVRHVFLRKAKSAGQ